jgi:hypothetical protein
MKLIAHRGLTAGPDTNLENLPEQILLSLQSGYDCEIDVRYIDGNWMLGHDNPDYKVPFEFLEQPGLWIHAKNIEALYQLGKTHLVYFWHQEDDFTLTSNQFIWTYPGRILTDNSIMVLPERNNTNFENIDFNCYAICSDYVDKLKKIYSHLP